jgi:hypothetical protein
MNPHPDRLEMLSPRERQVLKIIGEYLRERGQRCFSYDGIYAYYERCCSDAIPATSLDRRIRALAEKGVLERRIVTASDGKPTSKRRTVIFCWTDIAEALYNELVRQEEMILERKLQELNVAVLQPVPSTTHELEFFATTAPKWWRFQVVTPTRRITPQRDYIILHDNGAFRFHQRGENPDVPRWIAWLRESAWRTATLAQEVRVVLPDKIGDPSTTLELHRRAYRVLCSEAMKKHGVRCVAVVQLDAKTPMHVIAEIVARYKAEMPDIDIIAAPCKAPFAKKTASKMVVEDAYAIAAVAKIAAAADGWRPIHALAPQLKIDFIKRIARFIKSFDTSSWTRPITPLRRKLGINWSAKNERERELAFATAVAYLVANGIRIVDADIALQHVPERIAKALGF